MKLTILDDEASLNNFHVSKAMRSTPFKNHKAKRANRQNSMSAIESSIEKHK